MSSADATNSYSTADTPRSLPRALRSWWYRIAIVCWLLPLVVGLVIFGRYEVVLPSGGSLNQYWGHGVQITTPVGRTIVRLIDFGLVDLLIGATLAFYGVISLTVFAMLRWPTAVDRWRQVIAPVMLGIGLILSNFVVAAVLVSIVMR